MSKPTLKVTITFENEAEKESLIQKAKESHQTVSKYLKLKALGLLSLLFSFQLSAQDTICLPKRTYQEIYIGLQNEKFYRQAHADCLTASNELNNIIKQQNDSLQLNLHRLEESWYENDRLKYEIKKETPWYKKWYVLITAGIITGILIN